MIKLNKSIALLALVCGFAACDSTEKTTPTGVKYTLVRDEGEQIADSSYLLLNMTFKDSGDSVWMSTAENGMPTPTLKIDSVWNNSSAVEQVFNVLKSNDSVTFDIEAVELFSKTMRRPMPPGVDSTDIFTFNIGVADVLDQEGFMAWRTEMIQKQQEKQMKEAEEQLESDKATIATYLEENGIEAQQTESGISYVITEEGSGEQAETGDVVEVNYTGRVLEGALFDTSIESVAKENNKFNEQRDYGPYEVTLGQGSVIRGWDEGLTYLKEGDKATLYVPSPLAYGPRARSAEIGPNSILVFDVELVSVEKSESEEE